MSRPVGSVAVEHRLQGSRPEDWDTGFAPGYCTCGRWGYVRSEGPAEDTCPGLLAVLRGEEPPPLPQVIWHSLSD